MTELNPQRYFYELDKFNKNESKRNIAVFLDRDGVIIEDKHYIKEPKDIEFLPGSLEALTKISSFAAFVAIVTNQAGIAKNKLTLIDVEKVNNKFIEILKINNISINCLMYCPYHPEGIIPEFTIDSDLRKPNIGMFTFIKNHYKLKKMDFIMVGDKYTDIEFGEKIKAKSFLVETGYGQSEKNKVIESFGTDVNYTQNLLEVVKLLINDYQLAK